MSDSDAMTVFDRALVRRRRDRAAPGFHGHSFLVEEVAERLVDRLHDVRQGFTTALDLGCHRGELGRRLLAAGKGVETLASCDLSERMARHAPGLRLAADEEALPFAPGSFDLVVSALSLHWVNDLPGALIQLRRALRPDGLFVGAMLGGETLFELRRCLMEAELEIRGGVSPRVSPFAELRDAGSLLQRAGFALPVVDGDEITVTYENAFRLMAELRGMGETNAGLNRPRTPATRGLLTAAAQRYAELHAAPDGRIEATFQVVWMLGWTPHESQQKPLARGSAQHSLAQTLGTLEGKPPAGSA
ncbi:methyltransferase domain-containing protein [Arenibaculum pallidiluteum]|uniref:methyltransferase domain-containing protein n=1 Tax=Arenibaculum pallidiluteum TaxID=2812559 RepID=UPI001A967CAF|nr:methyltransferase domain-containing protein [Arenibaculum pallidiluteum]